MKQILSSWKTSTGAILVAAGYLADKYQRHVVCPEWVSSFASIGFVAGIILIGVFARDHNVSSEKAGAHKRVK